MAEQKTPGALPGFKSAKTQWHVEQSPSYPFGESHPVFCVGPEVDRPDSYYNAIVPVCYFPSKVSGGFFHNDPGAVEHAHLIAAAPEMLSALEKCVDEMTRMYSEILERFEIEQKFPVEKNQTIIDARAAIAKAQGGAR